MRTILRSVWVWGAIVALILVWFPLLVIVRLLDRDPVRRRTGRLFRLLGAAMTFVNPLWRLTIRGLDDRAGRDRAYVVVSNHQSHADIPLISRLPWEMKWVAKKSLFGIPIAGWMMRLAGDIPVDRAEKSSRAAVLPRALWYLQHGCSVMFFPEGTRSPDGEIKPFADGAFRLAVQAQAPILPLAVQGSRDCLPKHTWKFTNACDVRLVVLPPVETTGLTETDVPALRDKVRTMIVAAAATA
jgi:1-acyl-sn-glycerol-3-phosphate acyltransferase